jgi:nitronate monooxygenase
MEERVATIETALTKLLGIQHPILLAPMGSAAGGKLASAVSHAGGLGMLGSGYANEATIRKELAEAGNARVGVGFILWALDKNPAALDVALDARPAEIMLSFGDPSPYAGRIKAAGCRIICQVQTLEQAQQAASLGADVIIAQGRDAGGHSGMTRGTIGLVPAVVDAVAPIPVVAAGGIADGRGLAAALSLGAAGVSMGTRFTATRESLWDEAMKERAVASGGDQTAQTRVFDIVRAAPWPAIYPGRALRNRFFDQWHGKEEALEKQQKEVEASYLAGPDDNFDRRVIWAGEGVDLVRDVPSARDVIERIVDQAASVLQGSARLVR